MVHASLASNDHGGLAESSACLNTGLEMNRYYRDGQANFDHDVFSLVLAVCLVCRYRTRYRYRPAGYHNYDY